MIKKISAIPKMHAGRFGLTVCAIASSNSQNAKIDGLFWSRNLGLRLMWQFFYHHQTCPWGSCILEIEPWSPRKVLVPDNAQERILEESNFWPNVLEIRSKQILDQIFSTLKCSLVTEHTMESSKFIWPSQNAGSSRDLLGPCYSPPWKPAFWPHSSS